MASGVEDIISPFKLAPIGRLEIMTGGSWATAVCDEGAAGIVAGGAEGGGTISATFHVVRLLTILTTSRAASVFGNLISIGL